MPFLAYVHSRDPDPLPERPGGKTPWEPNWRVWRWLVAAVVAVFAATQADGWADAVLAFLVLGFVCQAAAEAIPRVDGMRDYRQ